MDSYVEGLVIEKFERNTKEIEAAVQRRDLKATKELVTRFLRLEKNSDFARHLASEYFRRLSDYSSALRVLPEECETKNFEKLSDSQLKNQLQLVRILNLLGASARALRIISSIPPRIKEKNSQQVTGILVSNYWYREAIPSAQPIEAKSDDQLSYPERLQLVSLADCYFGVGDFLRSKELLKRIIHISKEQPILGIAYRSLGAQFLLNEDIENAAQNLEKSLKLSPPLDQSNDRGLLEKWIGALECLRGNTQAANERLSRAWDILFRPGTKPEVWLEVCFWRGLCKFKEDRSRLPNEWAMLAAYPSPSNRMAKLILKFTNLPDQMLFGGEGLISEPLGLHIDLSADVLLEREKASDRRYQLGVNNAFRLLHFLTIAGSAGIPQYRAYEALWPDEPFSFGQHQKRIEQLIIQLRKNKIQVSWGGSHITLDTKQHRPHSTSWTIKERIRGLPFLEGRSGFSRTEVEDFFGVSKRSAGYLIEEWLQGKIVSQAGSGKAIKYRILSGI